MSASSHSGSLIMLEQITAILADGPFGVWVDPK